jgi:hypothetical protein
VGYFLYSQYLEKKVSRLRNELDAQYNKTEEANSRFWKRKELKKIIEDSKDEIISFLKEYYTKKPKK